MTKMHSLMKLKIEQASFTSANETRKAFFRGTVFSRPTQCNTSGSSFREPNIFMEDKSTRIKCTKENLSSISEMDSESNILKIILIKVSMIKTFYMERESSEMETFTKGLSGITRCIRLKIKVMKASFNSLMRKIT